MIIPNLRDGPEYPCTDDIWHTIFHEVLHCIGSSLNLKIDNQDMHDELDMLALALVDVLFRNDWMRMEKQ